LDEGKKNSFLLFILLSSTDEVLLIVMGQKVLNGEKGGREQ
jgi:hypothetical protein